VSTAGADAGFELLVKGQVDALAGLTQALHDRLSQLPGSRIVEGRFMGVRQSIAVPRGRDAGLAFLGRVVEDAKASGLVARAIERTGGRGVSLAPPAK
jgi:polar amino acid transport system substrate-binding protein